MLSPPGSPRPRSPLSAEEQETIERMFAFEKRPKTTIQLAMNAIIEDHSESGISNLASADNLNTYVCPRSEGDGCESPDDPASESRSDGGTGVLGSEEVSLFDAVLCILGEAFHDKEAWFLDEGFQSVLTKLVGGLLDGWLERQVHLLCSEHWCAFYLSELREVLWPGGELISAGQEVRTDAEKAVTRKEALESLINLLPESFYKLVDKRDWTEGLNLLLDSLGDPQLNRHLVFTALDLLMDALITEIKDEGFQRDLLSRV